jgi:NADH:ubiquinone reductase (H+-translocating)
MRKIVIIGGGFAGVNLTKCLSGNKDFEVTIVDKNNYHFFPPLIYQVATAFIEVSNICYPYRKMMQEKENLYFHYGEFEKIDTHRKIIYTDTGVLRYDIAVLALGTETNFFGMENVEKNAYPMKTIDDALILRNHLLTNLEKASKLSNTENIAKYQNIVIAGGGATGVEIAGMIAQMGEKLMRKDYPEIIDNLGKVYLINSGESLLAPMSKKSQQEALKQLQNLNVEVLLNTSVKDYDNDKVTLSTGEIIPAVTLLWTSGVIGRAVPGIPLQSIGRGRRITVDEFNRVIDVADVYAIGDICLQTSDPAYPSGHPQVAQVAIQQAKQLSENLIQWAKKQKGQPFLYKNSGSMAIISKSNAVVDLPKNGFMKGFIAWLVWLFIHIIPIVGFGNKMKLAYNWFWSYITDDPTLRLIIRKKHRGL